MAKSLEQVQALNGARSLMTQLERFSEILGRFPDQPAIRLPGMSDALMLSLDDDRQFAVYIGDIHKTISDLVRAFE